MTSAQVTATRVAAARGPVLALLALAALGLGGCSGMQGLSGLFGGDGGGEEQVVLRNPPLSIPPDFDLRPPVGGGKKVAEEQAQRRGRQTVFGTAAPAAVLSSRSPGEQALLRHAGLRAGINSRVRAQIDRETKARSEAEKAFVEKLLNWRADGAPKDEGGDKEGLLGRLLKDSDKPVITKKGEIF